MPPGSELVINHRVDIFIIHAGTQIVLSHDY